MTDINKLLLSPGIPMLTKAPEDNPHAMKASERMSKITRALGTTRIEEDVFGPQEQELFTYKVDNKLTAWEQAHTRPQKPKPKPAKAIQIAKELGSRVHLTLQESKEDNSTLQKALAGDWENIFDEVRIDFFKLGF